MKQKPPVTKNQLVTLSIDGYGSEGQGVGRVDGYAVFVPGALPGEMVQVRILKPLSHFAYGKVEKLLTLSPERTTPRCPLAQPCGGCSLQHMRYEEQLRFKKQKVEDALRRIGGLEELTVRDCLGMQTPWHYRNKAQFPIGQGKTGPLMGFYAKGSHRIVEVTSCPIQHPINDQILSAFRRYLAETGATPYDGETGQGLVRHLLTRVGFATGEVMVCVVANAAQLPQEKRLVELMRQVPGVVSVVLNTNVEHTNVILGKKVQTLWGKDTITDRLDDVIFDISPLSFYQVNPVQTEKLYRLAVAQAELSGQENVLDLYCGIGTISLFLAKRAKAVLGVEVVPEAIADAQKNAKRNGINNARFRVGDAQTVGQILKEEQFVPDVVVIDPPRKGCDETVIAAIAAISPQRVVYVSCEPSTLARDIKRFIAFGYQPGEVIPVDQFGQTYHVETVVLLSKGKIDSKKVRVEFSLEDMDMSGFQKGATYEQIKAYVLEHTGLKVSSLYISQVKRKCGLEVGQNYNLSKKEDAKVPQCPPEKEAAIMEALKHFQMT